MADEQSVDYYCETPHHIFEKLKLNLEYSKSEKDIIININSNDADTSPNRIYLTLSELQEIMDIADGYKNVITVLGVVEHEESEDEDEI